MSNPFYGTVWHEDEDSLFVKISKTVPPAVEAGDRVVTVVFLREDPVRPGNWSDCVPWRQENA